MPELPEVETIVRGLAPHLPGRRIVQVRYLAPRAALGRNGATEAAGQVIQRVRRHGKHILFDLEHGVIDIHLRMTGKLLLHADPSAYARAILEFDNGSLVFDDVRQFGYLIWRPEPPVLGDDALGIEELRFIELLGGLRSRIKPALLDQDRIAGIGNIYADEALFRARIHPLAAKLGALRLKRLHRAVQEVLEEAIARGGSSISDYVDAEGRAGSFQEAHRVYGRVGLPCLTCDVPIRRIVVGQRGTHFCPACQKR